MKKGFAFLLAVVMFLTLAACGGSNAPAASSQAAQAASRQQADSEDAPAQKRYHVVATLQAQQIVFWQHVANTWNRLAEENGFDLTIMDAKGDVSTFQNCVEDIIVLKPDIAVVCGIDKPSMANQVKMLQDAGIPTVAYNIVPEGEVCPIVKSDTVYLGSIVGKAAAQMWQQAHPDIEPIGAAIDYLAAPTCALRVQGFLEGFRSVYPDFELATTVDGNGTRADSLSAVEDVIQGFPQVNIFFGINGDSALGALDALKQAGKGTYDKVSVSGIDGTVGECEEILNPQSALKIAGGNSPRLMAECAWALCKEILEGKRDAYAFSEYPLEYTLVDASNAANWNTDHFE